MKIAAILLTLAVLAPAGCNGERGPKPKTDAVTIQLPSLAGPLRPV